MSSLIEKRKSPRIKVAVPLQYKELHGNTYLAKGALTKDLSDGGVRFVTDRFIGLACHLMLEMRLPSIAKPIKAISKPAWVRKMPHGTDYEIGDQFLAMSSEDEARLSTYLKTASA